MDLCMAKRGTNGTINPDGILFVGPYATFDYRRWLLKDCVKFASCCGVRWSDVAINLRVSCTAGIIVDTELKDHC